MTFDVAADRYDRFMGRYSRHLAPQMAQFAGIALGQRALDVGCGPGALTSELVARLGATNVVALDSSAPFVEAARQRHPGATVLQASAEQLPFDDDAFDATLAQLVVHLLADAPRGIAEMARVTRPDGVVAACVWDYGAAQDPLRVYWQAAREVDPGLTDESHLPGTSEGHLKQLFEAAGLRSVDQAELWATVEHASFEDWWAPFTFGVGPAGGHFATLSPDRQAALEARCRAALPSAPFTISARAWAARGTP
jgi:ubiquinone/menaquinone biosynthesis C-methylase UbiE